MSSVLRAVSSEALTDAECRTLAPARAKRLAYSLAGRGRYLYELVTGAPAVSGEPLATPLNPQGLGGVDRSGPPWGDAFMHPLWVGAEGNMISSGVQNDRTGLVYPDGVAGQTVRVVARFFVRPHQRGPVVPYSRAYLSAVGTRVPGAGTATATIRLYGEAGEAGSYTEATISTTSAGFFSTAAYTPVRPGWNERIMDIIQTSASVAIAVGPISLAQVVRRSH